MDNLETGKDKIKKICDALKNEAVEPAKEEAKQILENAQQEAHQIIKDAEGKAEEIIQRAHEKISQERELFETALKEAGKQVIVFLRQEIEKKLFNESLSDWIEKQVADPKIDAKLITVLIEAIEKEGLSSQFSALIPEKIPVDQVNAQLIKNILDKLREKSVVVGNFTGGVKLKLHDRNLTLDLSDQALKELVGQYVRKDFRKIIFQA